MKVLKPSNVFILTIFQTKIELLKLIFHNSYISLPLYAKKIKKKKETTTITTYAGTKGVTENMS
jgi:hypothetical protein